jgi:predicted DsbA family dithiol-disulfide isomerase
MQIDIVSDTICPWCFIGKRRLEQAVEMSGRNDIFVAWRPFQLNPDMPEAGMNREDYLRAKFGGGDRPRRFLDGTDLRQEVLAADLYSRRLGINGVPCFIVNRKYAISGAQPPAAFIEVFNLAAKDEETEAAQSMAAAP